MGDPTEYNVTAGRDMRAHKHDALVSVSSAASRLVRAGEATSAVASPPAEDAPLRSGDEIAFTAMHGVPAHEQPDTALSLLAAIAASSDDAIMTKDLHDRITTWNPGAERLYGYSATEMIGQPSVRLVPPDRLYEVSDILERLGRGERVAHYETVRLRKDGSRVDVSVSVSPLWDAAGHLMGAAAIVRDMTERKRAEREQAARARQQAAMAELRQRALVIAEPPALMDEAVALVARTLDVELCAILEPLPDDTALRLRAGVGWTEGLVGQATVGQDCPAGLTLAAGEPVIIADLRTEARFGDRALWRDHGVVSLVAVLMGGRERPVGVLEASTTRQRLFSADDVYFLRAVANLLATVSLRAAAEAALRVSERRYRAIFAQAPVGLLLFAPDGRQIDANQAGLDNVPLEQTTHYNVFADPWLAAAGVMDDIRRAFAGEVVRLAPLDLTATPYQGQRHWVQASLYPVKDDVGAVREVVAIVENITAQVQAREILEQRVTERTQELATLLEVSHNVASTLELEPLLALILDHLRTVVDYAAAEILLLEGEYLVSKEYRGPLSRDQVVHLRFPAAQGVGYQEVLRCGGPVIVDDRWGDTRLARAMREGPSAPLYAIHAYYRSFMVVPLMVKERIIGIVVFDHSAPNAYTPQHAALAQAIANQAAVAIENARLYARAQEMAAVEERARLARELHDSVTQMIFSASLIADVLPRLWESNRAEGWASLEELRLLTRGALAEMRTLLLELRPTALTETRLGELLQQLVEAVRGRKRLAVVLIVNGSRSLPPDVQLTLYRVAQEALNNAAAHAEASRVTVSLRYRRCVVALRITDNGRGFDPDHVRHDRFGLRIMRERAEAIGAVLTVDSAPGAGTKVRVVWNDARPRATAPGGNDDSARPYSHPAG